MSKTLNPIPLQPENPFHPGECLLEEFLEPAAISQAEFARRIGWTETRLNELICGKRGVSAEAARDLAEALHTSACLWMNLQTTWDSDQKLKRAVDGVGTLDRKLWFVLIQDALRTEPFPTSMMRTALLRQWQRTGHKPDTEIRLVQTVGESLAKARQIPVHHSSWKSLLQLLEEWKGVQWTEVAQERLHTLMRENRLPDPVNLGVDAQTQRLLSPKAFNREHSGLLPLAA